VSLKIQLKMNYPNWSSQYLSVSKAVEFFMNEFMYFIND
jgi:hypothetical protein